MEEEIVKDAKTILIVDDEQPIVDILVYNLKKEGYNTIEASDGITAINVAIEQKPDLILLDIMLPKLDGLSVCKRIKNSLNVPILMLTAKDGEIDKILGLELGADDYITKPFKPSLLYAKCLALLKRNKKIETNQLQSGKVILDLDKHILVIEENNIVLTDKEFKLIRYLMENQGIVLSREKILDALWGYDYYGDGRAVDTYIKRLRKRLGKYSYYIQTIVKTGYVWKGEELWKE